MIEINKLLPLFISLPERKEKLSLAKKEISDFLNSNCYFHIPGVKESSPYLGIAQAHMNAISISRDNDWPYTLIVEDDIQFRPGAKEYATEAFKHIPEDWDILLGGLYSTDGLTPYNEFWQQTKEFCGLQFYIVNSRAYDKILSFKKNMHIDRWLAGQGGLKCYVTNKFFAMQRPGFSDNCGVYKDYTEHLNEQIKTYKGFELL